MSKKKRSKPGSNPLAESVQLAKPMRQTWQRKPYTQVVKNKKAEQRRSCCRKGGDDGAVLFSARWLKAAAGARLPH